ncbi:cytochrome c-type biogenesis protein CcmE [Azospirillum sp. OGB3]|uniref:cytochrome c maturation protein CcmE domain-containing protein n=1 Tax=Azospirillum sp. OGB3 TaxID=2587012 RepID=UPI00160573A8|nr:cytochrome c maturation protein CcmE [Azospirillum sp. OGB3]MBB3264726.1 cytochrome c-type biogenesis protein CcmE [Azospirillum sp. OGB3]
MRPSTTLPALAAPVLAAAFVALLLSGSADAGERHRRVQAASPQPVAEVLRTGGGTVSGSVAAVGVNWMTVQDDSGRTDVRMRGALPEGIAQGAPITVTGRASKGGLMASEIILADGSLHRPSRDHDDD